MTVTEAIAINTLLRSLTNEDGTTWERMEHDGAVLADRAYKVLRSGHNAASFRRALARGQGFRSRGSGKKAQIARGGE